MNIGDVVEAIVMVIVVWGYGKTPWLLAKSTGFYEATDVCNELKRLHAKEG